MKIAIVASIAETLLLLQKEQIALLVRRGHQVHCVAAPGEWFGTQENIPGVIFHQLRFQRRISPFSDVRCFAALLLLFIRIRPQTICYSTPKAAFLASCAARIMRVRRRVYLHRGVLYCRERGAGDRLFRALDVLTCRFSHCVISMSASNRRYLDERRICAPAKLRLLGSGSSHGVDARGAFDPARVTAQDIASVRGSFGIGARDIVAGFVGRMVRDKGIPELLEAWRAVIALHAGAHLLVIGPQIEPRDRLPQSCARELGATPSIHLAGSQRAMAAWYAAMDFLVLPSHREGFPNAVLEAAAMEKPAVVSDAPGCVDSVVDGETGLLFPAGDARALAEKMTVMIDNQVLRRALGKKARQRALADFDPDIVNAQFVKCIEGE
jgi:glycosyltransferase involved in cell wall biosynthesis